jgi:hypothetical protein
MNRSADSLVRALDVHPKNFQRSTSSVQCQTTAGVPHLRAHTPPLWFMEPMREAFGVRPGCRRFSTCEKREQARRTLDASADCVRRTPESQRDSVSKPRVARNELPWEIGLDVNNPERVAALRDVYNQIRRNPVSDRVEFSVLTGSTGLHIKR